MVIFKQLLLFFILLFSNILLSHTSEIVTIYASEFDKTITQYEYLLVNFYSEDCPHSQSLKPIYNQLSEIVSKNLKNVTLAQVYVVGQHALINKYDIRGTPTVILFKYGEIQGTFYSEKTLREMFTWLFKKIDGKVKTLNKGSDIDQAWDRFSISLVLFGNKEKCPSLFQTFENSASQFDDIIFSYCESSSCFDSYQAKQCEIFLLKHFEEKKIVFNVSKESTSLNDWIQLNKQPLIHNFEEYSSALIFSHQNPAVILFRDRELSGDKNPLYELSMIEVAKKFKGKLYFVLSEVFTEWEKNLSELLDVGYTDLPCVYIMDPRNLPEVKKYKLHNEINELNIFKFVDDWLKGKLKPLLKSDEIPPEDNSAVVKEIVGKNYENVVFNEGIDVIVYFYAGHCENCIEFELVYKQLAEAMSSDKTILFTKIDANKNEIDGIVIEYLPAVFLYSRNDKANYLKYEGTKYTFEDLALWINQNLSKANTKRDL